MEGDRYFFAFVRWCGEAGVSGEEDAREDAHKPMIFHNFTVSLSYRTVHNFINKYCRL